MRRLAYIVFTSAWVGCAAAPPTMEQTDWLAGAFAELLDSVGAGASELPGAILRVEAPALSLVWTGAVGVSDLTTRRPLRPEHTLRIASNTKTYVAAAILRLVEDGRLELEAPIESYLLPVTRATLEGGGYDTHEISVRMLLSHTSGLFDYATTSVFLERVLSDPGHGWSRAEQLAIAMREGAPLSPPGEAYHYSDTGYILLGEILEEATGQPMNQAVRRLVNFNRLGLRSTWFETLDSVPSTAPPRAHQYVGSFDSNDLDPSMDLWGGGGLVSNVEDVARFYGALARGNVFRGPGTFESMVATGSSVENAAGYGMGIGGGEYDGIVCYGHGGYWGTLVRHCPELDLTIVAAVTNTSADAELGALVEGAIRSVATVMRKQN